MGGGRDGGLRWRGGNGEGETKCTVGRGSEFSYVLYLGDERRPRFQTARVALAHASEVALAAFTYAGFCSGFRLMQCNGT